MGSKRKVELNDSPSKGLDSSREDRSSSEVAAEGR